MTNGAPPDSSFIHTMRFQENEATDDEQKVYTADLTPVGALVDHLPGLIGDWVTVSRVTDNGNIQVQCISLHS